MPLMMCNHCEFAIEYSLESQKHAAKAFKRLKEHEKVCEENPDNFKEES